MNRVLLTSTVLLSASCVIGVACSGDDSVSYSPTTGGTGGSSATTGGTSSTGTGTGETTGGTTTTGGGSSNPTTTGSDTTGTTGTTGVGGGAGDGQGGGSGGAAGGSGGASGSSAGGSSGSSGSGGNGGSSVPDAGPGDPNCADTDCLEGLAGSKKSDFGFYWKDSWFITGCAQKAGHDCYTVTGACPGTPAGGGFEDSGVVVKETFPLGGTIGKTYTVSFTLHGISEGKVYTGGTPPTNPNPSEAGNNDGFYVGGSAVPSTYNVLRMRVLDSTKKEVGRYYMNSFPNASWESHRTFFLSYSKSIDVPGGGFIEYLVQDSNCRAIDNCGAGTVSETVCNAARNIPETPAPTLPMSYNNKPLASLNVTTGGMQPWHAQMSHLTITKVVAK